MLKAGRGREKIKAFLQSNLLRGAGWLTLGQVVTAAVAVLAKVVIIRGTSPEQYGAVLFAFSWLHAISFFSLPGLSNSLVSSIARGYGGNFRRAAVLESMAGVGGTLVLVVVALWNGANLVGGDATKSLLLFAALAAPIYWNDTGSMYLYARARYGTVASLQVAQALLALVAAISV